MKEAEIPTESGEFVLRYLQEITDVIGLTNILLDVCMCVCVCDTPMFHLLVSRYK